MRPADDSGGDPDGRGAERGVYEQVAEAITTGLREHGPAAVPGRLCGAAVALVPVDGASVSLRGSGMPVHLAASSPYAARLAALQATLGDGPCRHVLDTGSPVLVRDLAAADGADRWPVFAQQALGTGVRAVYALPLGSGSACFGSLDLYRDTPGVLTDRQLGVAGLVADAMTSALMDLPYGLPDGDEPWLSGLAADHDRVHQAVGMIMAQLGVGADEALARLRGDAFAHGRTALEVALDVVSHRRRFDTR
ncbi:GAF and ANTAR domain-containing protein [Streptomyces pilosus]|uniref:GAF domain-containing protein n=1 Tax=Streptomyces pilosus TaxID=28893 RepID=A0A918EU95_9ACTN|nr:GAF and ANTAR domain-containing protein [Streptomyces pilosus]GGQ73460.1 GAF domain-containing protein [Streptomyces pilosus]GGV58962.1 GAF domain-containing protein [Streptomyces pilosus]